LLGGESERDIGTVGLQKWGSGGDFDLLGDVADAKDGVEAGSLIDGNGEGVRDDPVETGRFNLDLVDAGDELTFIVVSGFVGGDLRTGVLVDVGNRDLGAGDAAAGLVRHRAIDAAKYLLSEGERGEKEKRKKERVSEP
jgi:hypothetical protein